ncbi:biotin transporter BioY, partial [Staphylococcus aureus]|uniref:biotin transporter BioY n=1 Tax=Staphylococcus aureus TaxID=1280 RepID=UPI00359CB29C|nr:biotin transporter BioY [Staphylococcus aureus]
GPSAGFLLLYPVVAFLFGAIRDRLIYVIILLFFFVCIFVFVVIALDVIGPLIMGIIINIPFTKAFSISLGYLPGDILKA